MTAIAVLKRFEETIATVTPSEDPLEWRLEWTEKLNHPQARRILKNAETEVLRAGGETLVFTCSTDDTAVRDQIKGWASRNLEQDGNIYRLKLICPAEDGLIHEDFDDRTPLDRITCPTCVERLAKKRAEAREGAFSDRNGPREIAVYTQRVAEAWLRLAEIENQLDIGALK